MREIKKNDITSKTIFQIFLMTLEIGGIVGLLTWGSTYIWPYETGLDILERIGLFYGFYQILVYIILSNKNDIKSDEFLALKNIASIALKACEYNDIQRKELVKEHIKRQLETDVFNDIQVRDFYKSLNECVDKSSLKDIEYIIIWAEHCAEESTLQWKFSFLLRLFK